MDATNYTPQYVAHKLADQEPPCSTTATNGSTQRQLHVQIAEDPSGQCKQIHQATSFGLAIVNAARPRARHMMTMTLGCIDVCTSAYLHKQHDSSTHAGFAGLAAWLENDVHTQQLILGMHTIWQLQAHEQM